MELSKSEIQSINALKSAHGRKKNDAFVVEGPKMIKELLSSSLNIKLLIGTEEFFALHHDILEESFTRMIKEKDLQRLSHLSTSNQVLAVVEYPSLQELKINETELILVLDTIQDPGNLGTIIRTADWFGISQIICSQETADAYSPKVAQASMGSAFRVNIHYCNLAEVLTKYSEKMPIYGSLLEGDNIYESTLEKRGFLIIGNESKGISNELIPLIHKGLYIPRAEGSHTESLNASVANGILLSIFSK